MSSPTQDGDGSVVGDTVSHEEDALSQRPDDTTPHDAETITVSYYALPWYKRPIAILVPVWLIGVAIIIYFTQFFSRVEEALVGSGVLEYLASRQGETDADLVAIAKENGIEGLDTYMFLDAHYGQIVWGTIAGLLLLTVLVFIWDSVVVRRHEVRETSRQLDERIDAEQEAADSEEALTESSTKSAPAAFASQSITSSRKKTSPKD